MEVKITESRRCGLSVAAGKLNFRHSRRRTEIVIHFIEAPLLRFHMPGLRFVSNCTSSNRFLIQQQTGIPFLSVLHFLAKHAVNLGLRKQRRLGQRVDLVVTKED